MQANGARGTVAAGFEKVADEFRRNFAERGEVGAACAVWHRGRMVVDLWGGVRDVASGAPWEEDTMVIVFSTTKGIAAMGLASAHSRGLFGWDDRIADHWPEFAQQGKDRTTIRHLLGHKAGLAALDTAVDASILADPDLLAAILARQKPAWEAGTRQGYHGITLGWYQGEILRRIDPKHRTLGRIFQEDIARPLDLEFHIGTPASIPESRIAAVVEMGFWGMALHSGKMPAGLTLSMLSPFSLATRSLRNPNVSRAGDLGRPPYRAVEIPSSNGIGEVRAIARAYGSFATGGKELGLTPATLEELSAPATPMRDEVLRIETAFSLGYARPHASFQFASDTRAFGTPGLGGSFGFADPTMELGFAYAPNRLGMYLRNDPREKSLRDAVYHCLR